MLVSFMHAPIQAKTKRNKHSGIYDFVFVCNQIILQE